MSHEFSIEFKGGTLASVRFREAAPVEEVRNLIRSIPGDNGAPNSGAAYVFVRTGTNWTQQAKRTADDGTFFNEFGRSVSLDGNTALIAGGGKAYVFFWTGTDWRQREKITPEGGASSVSLDGDTALIGYKGVIPPPPPTIPGWAHVYVQYEDNETEFWWQQAKLLASDGTIEDYFGCSVSIDGNTALIGAYGDDDNGDESG
jgi:hypothetical protein